MLILENLDALRRTCTAVETVVYMDLRSGTVLGRSAALDIPQELLDGLATLSSDLLGGANGETDEAVLLKPGEALVMRRAPANAGEALCLVCAPDADVSVVLDGARRTFEEVDG